MVIPQVNRTAFVRNCDENLYQSNRQSMETLGNRSSRLRRVMSMRALNLHIDSSESIPSEHSSLCDAVLASFESENNNGRRQEQGEDSEINCSDPSGISGPATESCASGYDGAPRRNTCAIPLLETIDEQPSTSTLRTSSRHRLHPRASGGISLTTKSSYSRKSTPKPILRKNQYGTRIYAFDDLDIPSFRPKFSFSSLPNDCRHSKPSSSSNDGSFETLEWLEQMNSPVEPTQPIYPPPIRSPTPPGVPSFGSPEAVRYSPSQSRRHQLEPQNNPHPPQNRTSRSGPSIDATGLEHWSCCGFRVRRLFRRIPCTIDRDVSLPTGSVARAQDGTFIRGRFGVRQSGHGIGAGPASLGLENHPFHRNFLPLARTKDMGNSNLQSYYSSYPGHPSSLQRSLQQPSQNFQPSLDGSNTASSTPRLRYLLGDRRSSNPPHCTTNQISRSTRTTVSQPRSDSCTQMSYCPMRSSPAETGGDDRPASDRMQSNSFRPTKGRPYGTFKVFSTSWLTNCCGLGSDDGYQDDIELHNMENSIARPEGTTAGRDY